MFMLLYNLKNRYMSQRAQGIVEYAIIIAFVIAIGWALLRGDNSMYKAIKGIFDSLWNLLETASNNAH